jgi:sirohydrochlorin cobaltochelatase
VSARWLILLAHGSREPRWREPFERLAASLAAAPAPHAPPDLGVTLAYLELAEPSLADAIADAARAGARHVRVLPLFLAGGAHIERDLPRLLDAARAAHPTLRLEALPPVGEHPSLFALIADLARAAFDD